MNELSNARHTGESFPAYQARRKSVNARIKRYLRGTFAHVSTRIVAVPLPMDDRQQRDVDRGAIRDLSPPVLQPDGKLIRLGRTKGETFEYASVFGGRPGHRERVLAERRAR